MRCLSSLLLGLSVSALIVGCPGDDGTTSGASASASTSTTSPTAPTSTSDASASSTSATDGATSTSSTTATTTSASTTAGGCFPDQSPCGGDCCDPNEICIDGACSARTTMPPTTDPSTGGDTSTGTSTGGPDSTSTTGGDPACALTPDTGPCDGAFLRFWFNPQTMKCEEFSWGGCGGVVPFEDLKSCQSACE